MYASFGKQGVNEIKSWRPDTFYNNEDTLQYLGIIYKVTVDFVSTQDFSKDVAYLEPIVGAGSSIVPEYDPQSGYLKGALVQDSDGVVYIANDIIPAGTEFEEAESGATWRVLVSDGGGSTPVPDPDPIVISSGRTYWVDAVNGNNNNDGNLLRPFRTVTKAMNEIAFAGVINVFPGIYEENITFKSGVLVQGYACSDSAQVFLDGSHIMDNVNRCKVKDLAIRGKASGVAALTFISVGAGINFTNVSFSPTIPGGQVLRFEGNNVGFVTFDGGSMTGSLSADTESIQTSAFTINLIRQSESAKLFLGCATMTVNILDAGSMDSIYHMKGILVVKGVPTIKKDSNGKSLVSTANAGEGFLFLLNTGSLQGDGSYGALEKTGTCPYVAMGVLRASNNLTMAGTHLLGEYAVDLAAGFVPVNYVPASASVTDHLKAIDTFLGTL